MTKDAKLKITYAGACRLARETTINKLDAALKEHASVLARQGFKFRQLTDDVEDLLCDVGWEGE